jgi:hypothetical protein
MQRFELKSRLAFSIHASIVTNSNLASTASYYQASVARTKDTCYHLGLKPLRNSGVQEKEL